MYDRKLRHWSKGDRTSVRKSLYVDSRRLRTTATPSLSVLNFHTRDLRHLTQVED